MPVGGAATPIEPPSRWSRRSALVGDQCVLVQDLVISCEAFTKWGGSMADITVHIDVPAPMAVAQARDAVEELRSFGLSVEGPTEPIEKRFDPVTVGTAIAAIPMIVRMTRMILEDLDRIVEVLRKWANLRREDQPKRVVRLLGPDGKVIRQIESDES